MVSALKGERLIGNRESWKDGIPNSVLGVLKISGQSVRGAVANTARFVLWVLKALIKDSFADYLCITLAISEKYYTAEI